MDSRANRKHKLIFLTVNSSFSHSSLALPLLHSACRQEENWEWCRYDMILDSSVSTAVADLYELHGDLLATDLYLFNRLTTLDVLQRYHALDPQCRIAVGGPECLGNGATELLQNQPWLDAVFRGEGEEIFRDYLQHFDTPAPAGKIYPASGNAVFQEWAGSPYPVQDPFFAADKPFVQMETSRGCPMGCFYCTSGGTCIRYRTLEQVREELQLLQAKGVKELRLLDRTFNLPQDRAAALLRMFREEFPGLRFHLELHPQFLGEELRVELAKALPGQLHIEVGIQCLDQEVQNLSGRRSDTGKALDGLAFLCKQSAFETHADLIAGLPGQSWQHILADTAALMQVRVGEIQLEVLKVLPGTPMREIAVKHGIKYSSATPYDVMMTATMALDGIRQARDLSRLLDMTYNHKHLHPAVLTMQAECPEFVPELLAFFHQSGGDAAAVWNLQKRFLFLQEFCRDHQLIQSLQALALQWLLAGFPPGQGADTFSRKADGIPEHAELLEGSADCITARETRFWQFPMPGKTYILAYNRAWVPNRPAAIWRIAGGTGQNTD